MAGEGTGRWAESKEPPRTLAQSSGTMKAQEEATTPLGTLCSPFLDK